MIDLSKESTPALQQQIKECIKLLCTNTELSAHLVDLKVHELQAMQEELKLRNGKPKESVPTK